MSTASQGYQTLTTPDGTPIYIPGDVDLSEDDADDLRTEGAIVRRQDGSFDIVWAYWRPQREAIQAVYSGDYDIVGFVAGYRSGKSVTGARLTVEVALNPAFAPSRSLAMGVSYQEAKKTTYPVLFEEIPGASKEELDPFLYAGDPEKSPLIANFSKQDGVLTWFNGSVTILASADKPDRYKGGKFSFAWLDEVAHYKEDRIHPIRKTIGERFDLGPPACQLWTTTGNGLNPAYDVLARHEDEENNALGSRVHTVRASSENNPFLTREDRARLRRTHGNSKVAAQALHGAFEAPEGQVYSTFRRQSHVVELTEDDTVDVDASIVDGWRMYGYDAGWNDPRVLLEIAKTDYGQFVVVDEFYRSETQVEDICGGPKYDDWWLRGKPKGYIYAEHNPADIAKFRKAGFKAGKAEKDIDDGIDRVRHRLRADGDGRVGLLVAERCENLIGEFQSYTEDDVGRDGADDHALDALRYALYTHSLRGGSSSGSSGRGSAVDKR